ncbi:acyltransferase [Cellulomonas sp. PhB150]|uniref:acyltransferase family protein n=1 Tax=Cellulomonas sp. PhB150 TaxID=2485188 RepID=UPI000F45F9A8|nr:acyltransferase [Cellulomonas sp. PhB150]ROS23847.1 peptidoglycan/LPS O-acetylase OafA/YrhL [Cellulomonas sp. PhB150]
MTQTALAPVAGPAGDLPAHGAPARGTRLRALDGLRLLAALAVCLYHYTARSDMTRRWGADPADLFPRISSVAVYGPIGVQLFFIISGFVICMSGWGRTVRAFAASRVARVFPAYWAALGLLVVAMVAFPKVAGTPRPDDVLVNLTLLQVPAGAPRILGVDWTLWVEAWFYVLFAIAVLRGAGASRERVVRFAWVWLAASLLVTAIDSPLLDELLMPDHAPFFVGGMALYLVHRFGSTPGLWALVAVSFALGQRRVVADLWHPGTDMYIQRSPVVIIAVVAASYLAVAAVALGWLRWARWRWLTTAGLLTYPFYLVHEHLGWFVITSLSRRGVDPHVTLTLTIVGMLCLAWLVHRLVERPLAPVLKRAIAARQSEKDATKAAA